MTQGFGQPGSQEQPGNQGYPAYPQTPGTGYPQQQAPYGAPAYPQGQYGAPGGEQMGKPGSLTGAAVLGYIQAGITAITTALILVGVFQSGDALGIVIGLAQLAGVVLLIIGSVQLGAGKARAVYLSGVILELVICGYYLISLLMADTGGFELLESMRAVAMIFPLLFAAMPMIGLFLALGSAATQYLQARRGR